LYWIFGIALLVSEVFTGRNLVRAMMEPNGIRMTEQLWQRVNLAWIAFFWVIGCLNLYVAFHMSRSFWVSFKSFGLTGLTFAFVIVQSVILARHIEEQPSESVAEPGPTESSRP
jgi:intracellular septation protein